LLNPFASNPSSTSAQAIDRLLNSYARFGVNLGLENSRALMTALRNPQKRVPIIHVAGSNGKGSVCAYLSSILTTAGHRVGRYTSPHLVNWNERICINENPISDRDLLLALQAVQANVPAGLVPTQFEILTAAMWLYFAQQSVDVAVIEVGLGGRLDATNVVDDPLVTVITSISLEHTERLGDTLAKIAAEKAGILKPGVPVVVGPMPTEASAVITRRAYDCYSPMSFPKPAQALDAGWAMYEGFELFDIEDEGVALVSRTLTFEMPLLGEVQLSNVALAIAAVLLLRQEGWEIPNEAITTGIAQARWAGRLQWYNWRGHKILIDGAHNADSVRVLRSFLDDPKTVGNPSGRTHWVMGMLATKDHTAMLTELLRSGDSVYFTPVPGHQSANVLELVNLAKQVRSDLARVWVFDEVTRALQAATDEMERGDRVVLCGSLYLVGDFLKKEMGGGK
jgi:dihydrofolate synthase / folylpolyglutamate synthase